MVDFSWYSILGLTEGTTGVGLTGFGADVTGELTGVDLRAFFPAFLRFFFFSAGFGVTGLASGLLSATSLARSFNPGRSLPSAALGLSFCLRKSAWGVFGFCSGLT